MENTEKYDIPMDSFDKYYDYVDYMICHDEDRNFVDYYRSTDVTKDKYRLLLEVNYSTDDFKEYKDLIDRGAPLFEAVDNEGKNFLEAIDPLFMENAIELREQLEEYIQSISKIKSAKKSS